jgi:hypothetical protein
MEPGGWSRLLPHALGCRELLLPPAVDLCTGAAGAAAAAATVSAGAVGTAELLLGPATLSWPPCCWLLHMGAIAQGRCRLLRVGSNR